MQPRPLRTTVIGSYPLPGWLELASAHLDRFGPADLAELQEDAVIAAVHDQMRAGLDVITDGEQTRLDFNLSFYGYLDGIDLESAPARHFGPPAHDQRGRHRVSGQLRAPRGLGVVAEFERLRRVAPGPAAGSPPPSPLPASAPAPAPAMLSAPTATPTHAPSVGPSVVHPLSRAMPVPPSPSPSPSPAPSLKASVPGPYTLSGRLDGGAQYPDRHAVAEALAPIVRAELEALVLAGCREIAIDEPSMSCYAYREDTARLVDLFNRTVAPVVGRCRLSTHLCFGNYRARAVGPRSYAPMFPAFLDLRVDEMHLEMASREFSELELIGPIAERMDVAVGVVDVKSSYVETAADVAARVRRCLRHAPAQRLAFAPDCGLSQTARFIARGKLAGLTAGVAHVRQEMGL